MGNFLSIKPKIDEYTVLLFLSKKQFKANILKQKLYFEIMFLTHQLIESTRV